MQPLNVFYENLTDFTQQIYDKIDSIIVKSNADADKVLEAMEDSYDRRYLCLTHKSKMYGFAYLHYD